VGALLAVASILIDLRFLDYYAIIESRDPTDEEWATVDRYNRIAAWFGWTTILATTSTIAAWCFWKYRCHRNLSALGAVNLQFTSRGAVGSYFMPFLNLFWPYQAMREIRWASSPRGENAIDCRPHHVSSSMILVAWWVSYFLACAVGQASSRLMSSANSSNDAPYLKLACYTSIVAETVFLGASFLAACLVANIVNRQELRAALVGALQAAAPPGSKVVAEPDSP
jgi:Domain of unknown function (DUF4328)